MLKYDDSAQSLSAVGYTYYATAALPVVCLSACLICAGQVSADFRGDGRRRIQESYHKLQRPLLTGIALCSLLTQTRQMLHTWTTCLISSPPWLTSPSLLETLCCQHIAMSWQLRLQFWKSSLPPTIEDVDGKAILYALDMTTDGEDCARLALDYIYSMCPLDGARPRTESQEDAEHLATFGHRYKVKFLSTASDDFLYALLKEEYQLVHVHHANYNYRQASKQEVMERLPDVMRWAMLAASKGLPKVLDYCEKWLACYFKQYPESYTHLQMLQNTSMVRILLMIRERVQ